MTKLEITPDLVARIKPKLIALVRLHLQLDDAELDLDAELGGECSNLRLAIGGLAVGLESDDDDELIESEIDDEAVTHFLKAVTSDRFEVAS